MFLDSLSSRARCEQDYLDAELAVRSWERGKTADGKRQARAAYSAAMAALYASTGTESMVQEARASAMQQARANPQRHTYRPFPTRPLTLL